MRGVIILPFYSLSFAILVNSLEISKCARKSADWNRTNYSISAIRHRLFPPPNHESITMNKSLNRPVSETYPSLWQILGFDDIKF